MKFSGGLYSIIVKSMCEHHPHGLDNPTVIVDFVEKYGYGR